MANEDEAVERFNEAFERMEDGLEPAVRAWTDTVQAVQGVSLEPYGYAVFSIAVSLKRGADALERIAGRLDANTDHRFDVSAFATREAD
jgi:hypothetical protein